MVGQRQQVFTPGRHQPLWTAGWRAEAPGPVQYLREYHRLLERFPAVPGAGRAARPFTLLPVPS
ncbi:hypothetical protein GCM10008937_05860 [Deinococcus depolymerans]|uniref:Uncharacterized protein n=1 Tax=Deinococcus depolymerans TaxID=392408 RepID=A0ABN1BP78_9DEIO